MLNQSKENIEQMSNREKRASRRIPVNIDARFFHGNLFYSGSLRNLSDKGMLIDTRKRLPLNSMFVVIIREENDLLTTVVKVKWISTDTASPGMGVELINPSSGYLNLVHSA